MNILINFIIAAVIFWLVYFFLLPLLPDPIRSIIGILVVLVAIVYLLSNLGGGWTFPWNK